MKIKLLNEDINYIYEDTGKPKVLFLHGFNSNSKFALEATKNKNFDYISFDYPGCGLSSSNDFINIDLYQKITLEFVKYFKLNNILVVSHSLGAASALFLLKLKIAKFVILVSPLNYKLGSNDTNNKLKEIQKWLLPNTIQESYESMDKLVENKIHNYKENLNTIAKNFLKISNIKRKIFKYIVYEEIANRHYLENEIKKLYYSIEQTKILIVSGIEDNFVNIEGLRLISQDLKIELIELKNCGHALFFEQPEKIFIIINKTLERN